MANQYKGEIKGKLGDQERTFRLTFDSIVNIENRTGKSIKVKEIQRGFTMKERLLRPSLVGVSKKSDNSAEKGQKNNENLEDK